METINHECYVSLEVAKLLKEAGFDWKLNSRWQDWGRKNSHEFILKTDLLYADGPAEYDGFHALPAPTLEVAQRWLREEHSFHIFVEYDSWNYFCRIDQCEPACLYKHREWIHNCKEFSIYEEALEAGIKKALEIILKEGE